MQDTNKRQVSRQSNLIFIKKFYIKQKKVYPNDKIQNNCVRCPEEIRTVLLMNLFYHPRKYQLTEIMQ